MRRSLIVAALFAASAAWAQEPQEPLPDVGFGGADTAGAESEQLQQLEDRVEKLETDLAAQTQALEEANQSLEELGERVQKEEASTAGETERTIAAHREARAQSGAGRADQISAALAEIEYARELIEAGTDADDEQIAEATEQLEGASVEAGRWGAAAEADHLARAARLVAQVPGLLDTRNFEHAMIALVLARDAASTALALARSGSPLP